MKGLYVAIETIGYGVTGEDPETHVMVYGSYDKCHDAVKKRVNELRELRSVTAEFTDDSEWRIVDSDDDTVTIIGIHWLNV